MYFFLQQLLRCKIKSPIISLPPLSLHNKRKSQGSVVIAYITWPFQEGYNAPRARGHTNAFEVITMAKIYQELGYHVNIIDYNDKHYKPSSDCHLAIDLHGQLEKWDTLLPKACQRILHATGPHWLLSNHAELSRLAAIRDRKGVVLLPQRQTTPSHSASYADHIVVLGNEYTMGSFQFTNKPITRIPLSSAYEFNYPKERNVSLTKKNFLWLGSLGMVHKGLDLVLEAFAKMPELSLTVCGSAQKEEDFFRLYKKELLYTPNIHFHGWIDMASEAFSNIARTHAAMIYPSCAEGGAGCVIHCMHAGLIPICTKEASVDLDDFGILIKEGSVEGVMEAARQFSLLSAKQVEERARASYEHARTHHTRGIFEKNYRTFASNFLKQ